MKRELRDKWVAALRSGEYKQAKGRLKAFIDSSGSDNFGGDPLDGVPSNTPIGFCCLGVLCDIVDPNAWEHDVDGETEEPLASFVHARSGYTGELLDDEFRDEQGLGVAVTDSGESVQDYLATQNDNGSDFNVIADLIEQLVPVT